MTTGVPPEGTAHHGQQPGPAAPVVIHGPDCIVYGRKFWIMTLICREAYRASATPLLVSVDNIGIVRSAGGLRWWSQCPGGATHMHAEVISVRRNQLAALGMAAAITLLSGACSGGPPQMSPLKGHLPSPNPGWVIPSTYQQACANEGSTCLSNAAGIIPAALKRPLHFPVLRPGERCPASHGLPVNNSIFGGVALGNGPVRPSLAELSVGDARRGIADLLSRTSAPPPWLVVKTLWFSVPAYQGPFVIRAERLGRPGPIALGESPTFAPLVVPPGPTMNGGLGWRTAPGGTWVKSPGCYAWQVDGLTFSYIIVVQAMLH
jgi:hypothetical protein